MRAELARGLARGEARDPRGAGDPRGGDAVLGHPAGMVAASAGGSGVASVGGGGVGVGVACSGATVGLGLRASPSGPGVASVGAVAVGVACCGATVAVAVALGVTVARRRGALGRGGRRRSRSPPRWRPRSPSGVAVGVAVARSTTCRRAAPVERSESPIWWPKTASSDAVTTRGADHRGQQAGDDRELPREAAPRGAPARTQAERVVLAPRRDLLRAFAARADAGRLLGAHRGAGRGAARDARRDLRDHLGRAVQRLRDDRDDDRGDGGGEQRAALPEHRHDDRRGDRGEARDQEGLEREAARSAVPSPGSPLRR